MVVAQEVVIYNPIALIPSIILLIMSSVLLLSGLKVRTQKLFVIANRRVSLQWLLGTSSAFLAGIEGTLLLWFEVDPLYRASIYNLETYNRFTLVFMLSLLVSVAMLLFAGIMRLTESRHSVSR